MELVSNKIEQIRITRVKSLDPVFVTCEDLGEGKGRITITCYGTAWTAYWGAMGEDRSIKQFFCDANEEYLSGKLSDIEPSVYDLDEIQAQAERAGISCNRDDPWNDYEFLSEMYGE